MTVVVLLGSPGAGKGTQAPLLAERLGVPHLASGDLLRAAVAAASPIGREVESYMSQGQLVPDDIVIRAFMERLMGPEAERGAVLDGFPRTQAQAEALDERLAEQGSRVDRAIMIDVPTEELISRLSGRWTCPSGHVYHVTANPPEQEGICDVDGSSLFQRDDDKPETVRARLTSQLGALAEVVEHYRRRGVLGTVDGQRPIDDVTADLEAQLERVA
jgi:adenylate kinase